MKINESLNRKRTLNQNKERLEHIPTTVKPAKRNLPKCYEKVVYQDRWSLTRYRVFDHIMLKDHPDNAVFHHR